VESGKYPDANYAVKHRAESTRLRCLWIAGPDSDIYHNYRTGVWSSWPAACEPRPVYLFPFAFNL